MERVTYEEACDFLKNLLEEAEYGDHEIIEYILETMHIEHDLRNS